MREKLMYRCSYFWMTIPIQHNNLEASTVDGKDVVAGREHKTLTRSEIDFGKIIFVSEATFCERATPMKDEGMNASQRIS